MASQKSLVIDAPTFSSSLQDHILFIRQKQHLQRLTEDINAIFSFYEYLESILASKEFRAVIMLSRPEAGEETDHRRFLCRAYVQGRKHNVMDRMANMVNKLVLTLSSLTAMTVWAGRGKISLFELNLGLSYDYRIVAEDTVFENLNADLGLLTKGSGYFPARLLGVRKAAEVLQWKSFDAEEALHLGLVDQIVPVAQLEERATHFVREALGNTASTMLGIRKLLKCDISELQRSLDMEDQLIKERLTSPEFKAGFADYCAKHFDCCPEEC